jgi:phosphoribosylaminoimidazole (AIR) synthetase
MRCCTFSIGILSKKEGLNQLQMKNGDTVNGMLITLSGINMNGFTLAFGKAERYH